MPCVRHDVNSDPAPAPPPEPTSLPQGCGVAGRDLGHPEGLSPETEEAQPTVRVLSTRLTKATVALQTIEADGKVARATVQPQPRTCRITDSSKRGPSLSVTPVRSGGLALPRRSAGHSSAVITLPRTRRGACCQQLDAVIPFPHHVHLGSHRAPFTPSSWENTARTWSSPDTESAATSRRVSSLQSWEKRRLRIGLHNSWSRTVCRLYGTAAHRHASPFRFLGADGDATQVPRDAQALAWEPAQGSSNVPGSTSTTHVL